MTSRSRLTDNLKKQINQQIDSLIKKIQTDKKFQKTIDAATKNYLIGKLEKIKIKI